MFLFQKMESLTVIVTYSEVLGAMYDGLERFSGVVDVG